MERVGAPEGRRGWDDQHDFREVHHGDFVYDSVGKDGPKAMDQDTKFSQSTSRYNAKSCYQWCINPDNKIDKPSGEKEHRGMYAATGEYHWRYYAEEDDGDGYTCIPPDRNYQSLPGSNNIYSWRAHHKYAPVIEGSFVSCFCTGCRNGPKCLYQHYTRAHVEDKATPEVFTTHFLKQDKKRSHEGGSDSDDFNE